MMRRCYRCRDQGHIASRCPVRKSTQSKGSHWRPETSSAREQSLRRSCREEYPQHGTHWQAFAGEPAIDATPHSQAQSLATAETTPYPVTPHPVNPAPASAGVPDFQKHASALPLSVSFDYPTACTGAEGEGEEDDDLRALDFPDTLLQRLHPVQPTLFTSRYQAQFQDSSYYNHIRQKPGWGDLCHDPAFAAINTDCPTITFAELEARLDFEDRDDTESEAKFDIGCLYGEQASDELTTDELSLEQEVRLAALGVSGLPRPILHRMSDVMSSPFVVPPWRRNHNSEFSRYFPGPNEYQYCFTGETLGRSRDEQQVRNVRSRSPEAKSGKGHSSANAVPLGTRKQFGAFQPYDHHLQKRSRLDTGR